MLAEAALEFGAVGALHDEDDVSVVEVVGRDRLLRIGRQAGGGGLDPGARGEDPLGRGGAEAVAGAEEEEVGQAGSRSESGVYDILKISVERPSAMQCLHGLSESYIFAVNRSAGRSVEPPEALAYVLWHLRS